MPCAFRNGPRLSFRPCQFAVPERELVEFDGQTWCRFHLPLRADEATSPKADWTQEQSKAFNEEIFARIDEAKKGNGTADLSGVMFPGDISFERYRGETDSLPEVLFYQASFGGDAWFEGAKFGGHASFNGASFGNKAWFKEAIFSGHTRFDGVTFSGHTNFEEVGFCGYVQFQQASFGGEARFDGARFGGHTWFDGASFGDDTSFEKARFGSFSWFAATNFSRNATFARASFGGNAAFWDTSFSSSVEFAGTSFSGKATFERASFGASADFSATSAATFHSISFAGARFGGPIRFHNRKFLSTTDFGGAFFVRAPEFHGCTLHQDTVFPPQSNFQDWGGTKAALAYRTLKHAMASVHARGEEAKFYALEQKALQFDRDTPRSTKLFSALYWLASDYGQSILRPLVGLLVTFAVFFGFYAAFLAFYLYYASVFVFPRSMPRMCCGFPCSRCSSHSRSSASGRERRRNPSRRCCGFLRSTVR